MSSLLTSGPSVWLRRSQRIAAVVRHSIRVMVLTIGTVAVSSAVTSTYATEDLFEAINQGDLSAVKSLLNAKADANAMGADGWTALIRAVSTGRRDVVLTLIEAKAEVNAKSKTGFTALMIAAQMGSSEIVEVLLGAKAEVSAVGDLGQTALHLAALKGDQKSVGLLLRAKADPNAKLRNGDSVLMYAVSGGHQECVQMLIDAKADVNERRKDGLTALWQAAYLRRKGAVQALLSANADVRVQVHHKVTPLMASFLGPGKYIDIEMVKVLAEHSGFEVEVFTSSEELSEDEWINRFRTPIREHWAKVWHGTDVSLSVDLPYTKTKTKPDKVQSATFTYTGFGGLAQIGDSYVYGAAEFLDEKIRFKKGTIVVFPRSRPRD